jgi:transposase
MTFRAADRLLEIVKETSGRKASFLSKAMLTPISASKALRLICKVPLPEKEETVYSHIGVDDWAFRKGTSYGTMLVNMDNGKVIDLLPGRDGLALKRWLSRHAGITLVNRDRAGAYTKAINETLPSTIQIADRFHLVKNFSDTVFEIIQSHYPAIVQTITSTSSKPKKEIKKKEEKAEIEEKQTIDHTGHDHREELLTEVKRLHRKGVSLAAIARTLRIDRKTARKYFYLNHIPHKSRRRLNYDKYLPLIEKEISQGIPLVKIHDHICKLGFQGCFKSFWNHFHQEAKTWKGEKNLGKEQTTRLREHFWVLPPKQIAIYLTCKDLNEIPIEVHRTQMKLLTTKNEQLNCLYRLSTSFRETLKSKDPGRLDSWLEEAWKSGIHKLKAFVKSIRRDILSVKNAIRYDFNSGMVEGCVNRLKNIKRQMYGRAGLDLLKRKVILSNTG